MRLSIKKIIVISFMAFMLFIPNASANSISVKSDASAVTKGSVVTVSVTVSSDSPIVSIEGTLSCSGAGASGGLDLKFDDSSNSVYNKSYSYKVKTTSSGTLTCSTSGARLTNMSSGDWQSLGSSSTSVTVKEPAVIPPKEYSKNNYLKSLSIEGYEISFDKETLEYSIEVENDVEKVNISASPEDSKASVSGTGEKEVTEGNNKLEVKVTAENGNERTYVINVKVKELDPINVKVDDEEYTVIRKEDVLEAPKNYEKTTVNINGEEVLAYYNDKTKYTLVGLKDKDGNANYYIYDNGKYTLYKEYTFNGITLYLTGKNVDIPSFKKTSFNYAEDSLEGYKFADDNLIKKTYALDDTDLQNFYLFYAVNIETGEESLYQYDPSEGTVQKYSASMMNLLEIYKNEADRNFILFVVVSVVLILLIVIKIVTFIIKKKKDTNGINKNRKLNVKEIDL